MFVLIRRVTQCYYTIFLNSKLYIFSHTTFLPNKYVKGNDIKWFTSPFCAVWHATPLYEQARRTHFNSSSGQEMAKTATCSTCRCRTWNFNPCVCKSRVVKKAKGWGESQRVIPLIPDGFCNYVLLPTQQVASAGDSSCACTFCKRISVMQGPLKIQHL